MSSLVYGGLDVHKESISACLITPQGRELVQMQVPNEEVKLLAAVRRWQKLGELRLCYEASGAGYVIKRWLDDAGVACEVIAPSKTPRAPGDRVKTDRLDAKKLAKLYAGGLLTPVRTPSQEEERARAIVRMRDEITRDMTRIKNRVVKHLGRLGIHYRDGKNWTQKHRRWLTKLSLDPTDRLIVDTHLNTLDHLEVQRQEFDERIAALAQEPAYRDGVQRLLCLRGIQVYSAMVLLTEIGDIARFGSAPQLMSYFGLVPRENSSGNSRHLGGITKTGNSRARWILAQAAWNQIGKPGCQRLRKHWHTQSPELVVIGRRAEKRLHDKFWHVAATRERAVAATAVARELAGFVWAILSAPCAPAAH